MTLSERVELLSEFIEDICNTTSILQKQQIINDIPEELQDDFQCVLECLSGVHKFGFTYSSLYTFEPSDKAIEIANGFTVREMINHLLMPSQNKDLSYNTIIKFVSASVPWAEFFAPIVNRTLKIGIGRSLLPKDGLSAMLAKKYENKIPHSRKGYYITEKLDGNRCIARFNGVNWVFTSRNGKPMHVNFDMSSLPKEFVYDGEILSPEQCAMSDGIYEYIHHGQLTIATSPSHFNTTSGLINRHNTDKNLVYCIFDIMIDDASYEDRRDVLEQLKFSKDTKLVKLLAYADNENELRSIVPDMLADVTDLGAEGLMVNLGDRTYTHKRTDSLLKVKKVQTIDMHVDDIKWGTGKYEGQVGALICSCRTDDGKIIMCDVGTGLSDEQRLSWAIRPSEILGKIVEIGYFSLSQDKSVIGTNCYSVRFPRLKGIRYDKNETSEN